MVTTTQKPARRGKRSAEEAQTTIENILEAGLRCFAQDGYNAASIKAIAESAGVTAPAVYNHFKSKADIYAAVCDRAQGRLMAVHEEAVAAASGAKAKLNAIIDADTRAYEKDPALQNFLSKVAMEVMHNPSLAITLAETISNSIQVQLIEIIEAGQEAGEIIQGIPASVLSQTYTAAVMGVAQSGVRHGQQSYLETIEAFKKMLNGEFFTD